MALQNRRPNRGRGSQSDDLITTLLFPFVVVGLIAFLGYFAYLGIFAAVNGLVTAAHGVAIGASNAVKIPGALTNALGYGLSETQFALLFIGAHALFGLATGVIVGLLRTYLRLRSKVSEALISGMLSRQTFKALFEFPGAYRIALFVILTNAIVGYAVGILFKLLGMPTLFDDRFVGPMLLLVSAGGAGSGGPGSLLFWILFVIVLVIVSIVVAITVAVIFNFLLATAVGAFGGSVKGLVKAFGISVVEMLSAPTGDYRSGEVDDATREDHEARVLLFYEGAATGAIAGAITGFIFALNAAGYDPGSLFVFVVTVFWVVTTLVSFFS